MEKIKLYNDDALKMIDKFQKENIKVNHIITDPPWNISAKGGNNFAIWGWRGTDFGEWDYEFDLFSWIEPYTKILDKDGTLIIFCSIQDIGDFKKELEKINFDMKAVLRWVKPCPMPRNRDRRFLRDCEFAVYAVHKKAKWVFNRPPEKPYLLPKFIYPPVRGKEKTIHTTQKPVKLMEDIIRITTNENDIILDPFMGSGSTGVAALNLKRKFIGIEQDPKYFEVAKNRLLEVNNDE